MLSSFFQLFLWLMNFASLEAVNYRNTSKIEATKAFQKQDYRLAATYYEGILRRSYVPDPEVRMNLAHCYFILRLNPQAQKHYEALSKSASEEMSSTATAQLGMIAFRQQDTLQALEKLKTSLLMNPLNDVARYNYELIRKSYHGSPPPPPKTMQKQAAAPPPTKTISDPNEQKQILNTLRQYDLDETQARMILDAMRNSEIQYLQQQKRQGKKSEGKGVKW